MHPLFLRFQHYFNRSNVLYSIRIFIALTGVTLGPWLINATLWTIPLTLGVVAAGLTDLDDRLTGRLRNLCIILICFFITSVSIELLIPYPWFFAIGLLLATWGLIMLGALGQRYATIAFGALLIAIYTMLGNKMYDNWYLQPVLLLSGALWYNLITLFGHIFLPIRPLQDNVIACYNQLALYLDAKATLFDADEEDDFNPQLINLAMVNSALVNVFNQTKGSLLTRLKNDRGHRRSRRMLHYYFVAQDIHEQISSAHVKYQALSEKFRYSDILFRFQRLLTLQALACRKIAQAIELRNTYQHDPHFERTFSYLENALTRFELRQDNVEPLIKSLRSLLQNLKSIDIRLTNIEFEQTLSMEETEDNALADEDLHGIKDVYLRIRSQLTAKSPLFRHAVRMSLVLCLGYLIIQLANLQHGYWIMLTSLFVCQPNYSATRSRLKLRVLGTLAGIFLGLPILYFIPSIEGQLILIVISGVLFFIFRHVRYAYATMFITFLVLLCFNLLGEGFEIAIPRIIDTLIGCAIAWLAVSFIWPDWKFRELSNVVKKAIKADTHYFSAVLEQYHQGKDNSLNYRIARRNAHNGDAELASVISSLSAEPKKDEQLLEQSFRLLCLSHTLLGYISALGAHRQQLAANQTLQIIDDASWLIIDILTTGRALTSVQKWQLTEQEQQIMALTATTDAKEQLVIQQLTLIISLLPELLQLLTQVQPMEPLQ